MIAGIKRRNVDPGIDPISILEKNIKNCSDTNIEMDLKGKPKLNLKPIFKETQDQGIVGKIKLSVLPSFMKKPNSRLMGKTKLNTDFIELPNKANTERLHDEPAIELIDTEPDKPGNEQPISNESNAKEIFAAEPSDAEPQVTEPVVGEDIPDEPTSNTPTPARIIDPPAAAAAAEPVDEISDDSDDPDGEDGDRRRVDPRKRRVLCALLAFCAVNAIICLVAYGIVFTCLYRVIKEPHPNPFPLLLTPRERWSTQNEDTSVDRTTFVARCVTVVQTDTKECVDFDECLKLLVDLERDGVLPYNFAIAPSGEIFEVRGWHKPSSMFTDMPTLVVAFIGDYNEKEPSVAQLTQLKTLLSTSEYIEYLDKSYKIHGRKIKNLPTKLFEMMKVWEKYDHANSDTEYVSIDVDPESSDKD